MKYIYLFFIALMLFLSYRLIFSSRNIRRYYLRYKSMMRSYNSRKSFLYTLKNKVINLRLIRKIYVNHMNKKKNKELYFIILQLQNIVVTNIEKPVSMNYMISNVLKFSKYTKDGFMKFIYYYNLNDRESAVEMFKERVPTRLARDLIYILAEMDYLDPKEVLDQFISLEERVKNDIYAEKDIEEERISNFMYILPVFLCFIIMLNFVVIIMKEIKTLGI